MNPYDNEHADVNGDGVQLYLSTDRGFSGWMIVPDAESSQVRIRQLERWTADVAISAASATGVLTVPTAALVGTNGSYLVRLLGAGGEVTTQPVTIGLVTNTRAEVRNGLTEGQTVITGVATTQSTTTTTNSGGGFGGGGLAGGLGGAGRGTVGGGQGGRQP